MAYRMMWSLALLVSWLPTLHAQPAAEKKQPADRLDGPPLVTAKAWAVADGKTGKFLWGSKEDEPLAIASTTKMMTAWIVLQLAADNAKVLDEIVVVSEKAAKTTGSSAKILAGDRCPVRELLYGLLLPSGNDAATAFAEHFGPRFRKDGEAEIDKVALFVAEMNRQAKALKLEQTKYLDPHGLQANKSSARDLTALTATALKNKQFAEYVQTRRHEGQIVGATGDKRAVVWQNTNQLLGIEGFDGVKTGSTNAAGSCLVASGRRESDHLIVVVLGSTSNDGRYVDSRNLLRWAWQERGRKAGGGK